MPRTRTRSIDGKFTIVSPGGSQSHYPFTTPREYFYESRVPGGNYCKHVKVTPNSGEGFSWTPWTGAVEQHLRTNYCEFPPDILRPPIDLSPQWDGSDFEILLFIRDWDQTIDLVFGTVTSALRKILTHGRSKGGSVSYGALEWGIKPLISDLKSLSETLNELGQQKPLVYKEASLKREWSQKWVWQVDNRQGNADITYRYKGSIVFEPPDMSENAYRALRLANELGFHPDLRTVWDSIPLSFVVDYFFQVGRFLEQLSPRGWIQWHTKFSGWSSIKAQGQISENYQPQRHLSGFKPGPLMSDFTYYERWGTSGYALPGDVALPQLQRRNTKRKHLINTLYLALGLVTQNTVAAEALPLLTGRTGDALKETRDSLLEEEESDFYF